MSDKSMRNRNFNALQALENFISQTGLENVKTVINTKAGTASITGSRDGYQYTTTVKQEAHGVIQSNSSFETNIGKDALIYQIKQLREDGYKQREIADMLGISQSLVSKYSRY